MKSKKSMENKIKKDLNFIASETLKKRLLTDVLNTHQKLTQINLPENRLNIWRIIMKNKISKIASAAVILIAVALSVTIIDRLTTPAWAIEQTIQALKETKSVIISGTTVYDSSNYLEFKCWVKFDSENNNLLMRFESPREIVVVRGDKAYSRKPGSKRVQVFEGSSIRNNLTLCSEIIELSPWLKGKIMKSFKLLAHDWQEEFLTDEKTGREIVSVNCSFKKIDASFAFVFDVESKLIIEGKQWNNPNYKDPVNIYANSFVYNEDIPDETFNFEMPENAKVIHIVNDPEKQRQAKNLMDKAENLFHKERKYAEALELYKQVYEKYPDLNNGTYAANALMMTGICYSWLNQPEKGIEAFLTEIEEYGHLGGMEATYLYLGDAYFETGQKEKGIEAFENCLKVGEGTRDPDKFPLKNARETIEKLKVEN